MKTTSKKHLVYGLGILLLGAALSYLSHFMPTASAAWSRGNWLDDTFWDSTPNTGNIIYALYGDGTPGSTVYTKNWIGSCIPTNVEYRTELDGLPISINANTVYILEEGNYVGNNIQMKSCSALIGKGDTTITNSIGNHVIKIQSSNSANNVIIDNIQITGDNTNDGIYIYQSTNNTINNIKTHNNRNGVNLFSNSNYNTVNNIQSYNNSQYGIIITSSSYNRIESSQIYNNISAGIYINLYTNNTINNCQIFNNSAGMGNLGPNTTINNSQIYNNAYGFINVSQTGIINNTSIYNNSGGIMLGLFGASNVITNKSKIYNNDVGILELTPTTGRVYVNGELQIFGNRLVSQGPVIITNNAANPTVGWSAGNISYTGTMSYYELTNPKNANGTKFFNGTIRTGFVGTQVWDASFQPIQYIFGTNIPKQTRPVEYSGTTLKLSTTQTYDTTKYIAQPESVLSDEEQAIAEYYFGVNSEFTKNRDENICTLGAFSIVYLTPGTLPTTMDDHTIYILDEGNYATDGTIIIGDCIAIAGSGNVNVTTINSNIEAIFLATGRQNLIFNNLRITGNGGNVSQHGIKLDQYTTDSTINNVKVFDNVQNGITLGIGAQYITTMNSQAFNNGIHGIEIYYIGKYNFINNSLAFNNKYGVRFGNGSIKNTINNSQFYNNEVGVFADLTTQENLLNNVVAYNNAEEGIKIKQSSGNMLNKIQAYNNKIGINIGDTNSTNNQYFNELYVFSNTGCGNASGCNFTGTNGNDSYLAPGIPTYRIQAGWLLGTKLEDTMTASCNTVTNVKVMWYPTGFPNDISWLLDFLADESNCLLTGQNTWNPVFPGPSIFNESTFDFLFGNNIPKQIHPVGYSGAGSSEIVVPLNTQYDGTKYIGEVSPIRWYEPSDVIVENVCSLSTGCAINTEYLAPVTIERGMVNANVWAKLITSGAFQSASLEVYTGTDWVNVGTESYELPFGTAQIRIRFTTVGTYNTGFSLKVNIGATGNNTTGTLSLLTQQDPTPPVLAFTDNIAGAGARTGNDVVAVTGSAIAGHSISSIKYILTGESTCTTTMFSGGTVGTTYTTGITVNSTGDTDKYFCFWIEDTTNHQEVVIRSNQIKIANLGFNQPINAATGYYQIIDINFQNLTEYGYAYMTSGAYCTGSVVGGYISGTSIRLTGYTAPVILNSTTAYNGNYVCIYGKDTNGKEKFILSPNYINIQDYSSQVHFTNDVAAGPVKEDTMAIYFASGITTKLYTYVTNATDCNSVYTGTAGILTYPTSGDILITSEGYNGKYMCVYTINTSGFVYRTISTNKINIDITAPSIPSITYPLANQDVRFLTLEWTASTDNNTAGISGYEYLIADDLLFEDLLYTGRISGSGTRTYPTEMDDYDEDVYYWKIRAFDVAGNVSNRSTTGYFNYLENSIIFDEIEDADKETVYESNEVTLSGLRVGEIVDIAIDLGVLFKNGVNKGTGTTVQNGDKIYIEIMSSEEDDETVTSTLTITNRTSLFEVTTKGGDLDEEQMLRIISIFNAMIDTYQDNEQRLYEYLYTFRSMLEDKIDLTDDANEKAGLEYLLDLVNNYLENEMQNGGLHVSPNCKEYEISMDEDEETYYSPTMRNIIYFASREALIRFIDVNNPGDCHRPTYGDLDTSYVNNDPDIHIAPNGKVYHVEEDDLGYTSSDMAKPKYFLSISELRAYISRNNPAITVWDHEVDTDFDPLDHTAPNGKTYTIYKTDMGYMSYKLVKVKYYSSLEALTTYIDKNNQ